MNVPTMAEIMSQGKKPEVLFWVGAAGSYDDRAKKITRAFVKLLHKANVDFAVLGTEESSTGDAAKRAGVFTGFTRLSRMILWVGFGEEVVIRTDKNRYARPQQMAVLSAPDTPTLVEMVLSQSSGIIKSFKKGELAERERRTLKSTLNQNALKDKFGIDLTIPSAYKVFKEENSTVWFQREIRKGHVNLIVYELPITTKLDFEQPLADIIRIRDSVGQAFIPGRLAKTHLITEAAYEPYVYKTSVDGIRAIETRGTWEVKGDFMAGPFLQFLLDDKKNNRYLVMEGFVFAPSAAKRDYVFETEAIMQSMQQQKKD